MARAPFSSGVAGGGVQSVTAAPDFWHSPTSTRLCWVMERSMVFHRHTYPRRNIWGGEIFFIINFIFCLLPINEFIYNYLLLFLFFWDRGWGGRGEERMGDGQGNDFYKRIATSI